MCDVGVENGDPEDFHQSEDEDTGEVPGLLFIGLLLPFTNSGVILAEQLA